MNSHLSKINILAGNNLIKIEKQTAMFKCIARISIINKKIFKNVIIEIKKIDNYNF